MRLGALQMSKNKRSWLHEHCSLLFINFFHLFIYLLIILMSFATLKTIFSYIRIDMYICINYRTFPQVTEMQLYGGRHGAKDQEVALTENPMVQLRA